MTLAEGDARLSSSRPGRRGRTRRGDGSCRLLHGRSSRWSSRSRSAIAAIPCTRSQPRDRNPDVFDQDGSEPLDRRDRHSTGGHELLALLLVVCVERPRLRLVTAQRRPSPSISSVPRLPPASERPMSSAPQCSSRPMCSIGFHGANRRSVHQLEHCGPPTMLLSQRLRGRRLRDRRTSRPSSADGGGCGRSRNVASVTTPRVPSLPMNSRFKS